nr:alcohol dehydrogenase [Bacteroidales bacterium]
MKFRLLLAVIALFCVSIGNSQDPTVWRNGTDGVYPDTDLLDVWYESGPEILWLFEELGQGHSSPIVVGGFLYANGMIDNTGYLFKFNLDGSLVYKKSYGPEFSESFYGPR